MVEPTSSSVMGVIVAFVLSICLWIAVAMIYTFLLWP